MMSAPLLFTARTARPRKMPRKSRPDGSAAGTLQLRLHVQRHVGQCFGRRGLRLGQMEAEDIMQESFLKAFTNIKSFRSVSSFGTWIKKIAINRSLNAIRKQSPDILDFPEGNIPDQVEESATYYEKFSMDQIRNEINELPEGYSVVLNLHLFEGMDHDEIGQILNIKPVTSRSQYMRAKQKLVMNLNEKYHARQA